MTLSIVKIVTLSILLGSCSKRDRVVQIEKKFDVEVESTTEVNAKIIEDLSS